MAGTTKDTPCHTPVQAEALVHAFLDSRLQIGQLGEQARFLLLKKGLLQAVEKISPEDQEKLIDKLNQVYLTIDAEDKEFSTLFGKFCGAIKQLPGSVMLSAGLVKVDNLPMASGGLMDVWRGEYQGTQVAIRAFRAYSTRKLEEAEEILWRFVPMWKKFTHPSIIAFRGVTTSLFQLALVYDWGENGNIMQYIESHPAPPRLDLLLQVASGLQYLHSLGVPHGNLKGSNVLIDQSGHVRLTDYGLAPINANPNLSLASPTVGNARWLAPEIISSPPGTTDIIVESEPADIFAFGMLAIEVFTGEPPFEGCSDSRAARQILGGHRPEFPQNADEVGLTVHMWGFLRRCWLHDPAQRPTADVVVRTLEGLLRNNGHMQRAPSDQNHGEPVPGVDEPLSGPQPTPQSTGVGGQPTHLDTPGAKNWWRKWLCGWI